MAMIPSKKYMNYEKLDEMAWNGMFVAACLSDGQRKDLKAAWEAAGGFKTNPWWKFVLEHTKVSLDLNKRQ